MTPVPFDLSKVQSTSVVNSFKNDGGIYKGSLTLSASIPAGSFLTSSTTVTLTSAPQFCMLYAFFQEYMDVTEQWAGKVDYNPAAWYLTGINNRFAVLVSAPGASPPADGIIYPVINGNQVTVNAILNNPYSSTMTYTALTIPFAFFEYTMTN